MPKLVKKDSVSIVEAADFPNLEAFLEAPSNTVKIAPDDDIEALASHITSLEIVAFEFSNFMDGRSFSQARLLRDALDFKGEVRAVGAFIQDQLHYLSRCGFDAYEIDDAADIDSIQQSLADFSESYQAAYDNAEPLFRRRA